MRLQWMDGGYWLWPLSPDDPSSHSARVDLATRLMADGEASEQVDITFVAESGLENLFVDAATAPVSIGWEGLLVPSTRRRAIRLPAGISVDVGASDPGLEALVALRPNPPWVIHLLKSPHLDLDESLLIRREGELIGWVPLWRPSASTSIVRLVILRPDIHAGEERRRTHLSLGAYAQAIESQFRLGRSVFSWIPDDGDPVNVLKLSVGSPVRVTHWKRVRVRRDLATAPSSPGAVDVS